LQLAVAQRSDVRLISAEEMNTAASRQRKPTGRVPFVLRAKRSHRGKAREMSVVPDLVFGLQSAKAARRNFLVEIDRGTMPVRRSDPEQTSFEGKMRVYLAAHALKQHERQFGWKNFRVLALTTDPRRLHSMMDTARHLRMNGTTPSLFLYATFDDLRTRDPLAHRWLDSVGNGTHLF
jgi:hypothetical protein